MTIYTFYTESHRLLLNKLEKSLKLVNTEANLIIEKYEQECSTGKFMESGWSETMKKKTDYILRAIEKGETFIHSDCDIIYLQDPINHVIEELGDYDIAFQSDTPEGVERFYCMGFFVCKPSFRIRDLFIKVYENIDKFEGNDQLSLNNILSTHKNTHYPGYGFEDLKYKFLSKKFFTYGISKDNPERWDGQEFEISENTVMFHANWTVGVENKLKLIDYVAGKTKMKL